MPGTFTQTKDFLIKEQSNFCPYVNADRMKAVQVLLVTLLAALVVRAQSFYEGQCPVPPVQQDFDIVKVRTAFPSHR